MTNFSRAFGDDATLLLLVAVPFAVIFVAGRAFRLRGRVGAPYLVAALEAAIVTYALLIGSITLTSSSAPGDGPRVDWSLLSSDLGYGPQRTQVIGNLLLFAPLLGALVLRFEPLRRLPVAIGVAVVLPAGIEALQYVMDNGRAVTVEDWLLGSLGGTAAALVARVTLLCAPVRSWFEATSLRSHQQLQETPTR